MKIKNLKTIWGVILMFLLASPANAKLSESQMCSKIMNFYKEYIRLSVSKDSGSEKKCMELISKNCTSSFASTIKEDSEEGMGLDYICCEYVDDIDLSQSLDVIKDDKYYIVFFYANCLQRNGKRSKLRIQLRVTVVNDLISDVEDPFPAQRNVDANALATICNTRHLNSTIWKTERGDSYRFFRNGYNDHVLNGGRSYTRYKYYLSKTIPSAFDFSKVGTYTEGCYLVEYDSSKDTFLCYSIVFYGDKDVKEPWTGIVQYVTKAMILRPVDEDLSFNQILLRLRETSIEDSSTSPETKSTYDTPMDPIVSKEYDVLQRETSTGGNTTTSGKTSTSGNSSTGKSTSTSGGSTTKAQTNKYIGPKDQLTPLKE